MKTVLVTSLYNETKPERSEELLFCLKNNLTNPYIDEICVVFDDITSTKKSIVKDYVINNNSIRIENCIGKPLFSEIIKIVNEKYSGYRIMIANSDIHYDNTLSLINGVDLANKVLTLSRYNLNENKEWELIKLQSGVPNYFSADTWIFQSPFTQKMKCEK